jgi:hypothetical protein
MEFRRELQVKPFEEKLSIRQNIMLAGSCFTEHLSEKLIQNRFNVLQNPNGIIFNPMSIARSVSSYVAPKLYEKQDIFLRDELWTSWEHHSRFTHTDADELLRMINHSQIEAHDFLKQADWMILTLGSAWVYQLENGEVVANCHKVPTDKFRKKLLSTEDVLSALDNMIHRIFIFNPKVRIIFTISPVRHLRDGFVENNRSKAILIQAVHHLVEKFNNLYYFPAYELIIDDLRDYRFYAEDMVHPNYQATAYVWQKFSEACLDAESQRFMKEIFPVNAAIAHKPFQPDSLAHRNFRKKQFEKLLQLKSEFPFLNFDKEMDFFRD